MKDLQNFNFNGNEVEIFEYNGEILFNPKDVAKCLDITDVNSSIRNFKSNQKIKITNKDLDMHNMHIRKLNNAGETFLKEAGVYKLIFKSHKESAERFQDWVTDEVLPSIRKHGAYMTDDILERTLADPDFLINLLTNLKEEKEKRKLAEERTKRLIHNSRTYTATEIAKELGFKSAKVFNKDLENKKIQYKINGVWVLSADYSDKDYVSIKQQELDNGTVIYNRRWTGLGRVWLLNEIYGYDK